MSELQPAWRDAIELQEADMRRRNAAPRTRRSYGADLAQFAAWAGRQGLEPAAVGPKQVRRYIAHLSRAGAAPSTTARKRAALRTLFKSQREQGRIAETPAELVATPRRPSRLPRLLSAREAAGLLDSIPAGGPLELRDRAMFELAYGCGLRAEELVSLQVSDIDHDAEQVRVEGKGSKTRFVPAGEPALAAVSAYLERARPALEAPPPATGHRTRGPGAPLRNGQGPLLLSKSGRPLGTSDVRPRLTRRRARAARTCGQGTLAP